VEVTADSPSANADAHIVEAVGSALVAWHPERGWTCSVVGHLAQPCEHTVDLMPIKSKRWNQ